MAGFHRDRDLEHFDEDNDATSVAAHSGGLSPSKRKAMTLARGGSSSNEEAALESLRKRMAGRESMQVQCIRMTLDN